MAVVYHEFAALAGEVRTSAFPGLVKANGSNIPIPGYAFDASTDESLYFYFDAVGYGSGNVTVDLLWYADTASTNTVVWGAQLAAITPNTDSQDIETDALATAATTATTHLGTTGQRLHKTTITISSLDSLAARDFVMLRVYRDADSGTDTMSGDAVLVYVSASYSDT